MNENMSTGRNMANNLAGCQPLLLHLVLTFLLRTYTKKAITPKITGKFRGRYAKCISYIKENRSIETSIFPKILLRELINCITSI